GAGEELEPALLPATPLDPVTLAQPRREQPAGDEGYLVGGGDAGDAPGRLRQEGEIGTGGRGQRLEDFVDGRRALEPLVHHALEVPAELGPGLRQVALAQADQP